MALKYELISIIWVCRIEQNPPIENWFQSALNNFPNSTNKAYFLHSIQWRNEMHTWKLNGKLKNTRTIVPYENVYSKMKSGSVFSLLSSLPLFVLLCYLRWLNVWLECIQAKATTNKHDTFFYCIVWQYAMQYWRYYNTSIDNSHVPNDIYLPILCMCVLDIQP